MVSELFRCEPLLLTERVLCLRAGRSTIFSAQKRNTEIQAATTHLQTSCILIAEEELFILFREVKLWHKWI